MADRYIGPAGVDLSRADLQRIHTLLLVSNLSDDIELRNRIRDYLTSDWQDRAEQRARAIEAWTPPDTKQH